MLYPALLLKYIVETSIYSSGTWLSYALFLNTLLKTALRIKYIADLCINLQVQYTKNWVILISALLSKYIAELISSFKYTAELCTPAEVHHWASLLFKDI